MGNGHACEQCFDTAEAQPECAAQTEYQSLPDPASIQSQMGGKLDTLTWIATQTSCLEKVV